VDARRLGAQIDKRAQFLSPVSGHDESWRKDAACLTEEPELFFPVARGMHAEPRNAPAKRVCARCRVRADCLAWALGASIAPEGVWGGTSQEERAELIRNKRQKEDS
jgi:WhiB family redox-sensing transcriptional regulator